MTRLKFLLLFLLYTTGYTQAQNQPEAWELLATGTTADLFSVHCINKDTVFACGTDGTIIKTTDGGENWTILNTGTNVLLKKIRFANDTLGYAVGETGTIIKTINAGETWVQLISGTTENLNSVFCIDKDTVYAVGNNGILLKTINGGGIWNSLTVGTSENLMDIAFPSTNRGFAVGNGICDTENFGESWNYGGPSYSDFRSIYFLDSMNGYIGSTFFTETTFDGGNNWSNCFALGENSEFWDIDVTNSGTIYFVGMVYTWQPYATIIMNFGDCNDYDTYWYHNEYEYQYNSVDFITDSIGYVAGYNGLIRKTDVAGYDTTTVSTDKLYKEEFEIYPNPTTGNFIIKSNLENTKITISIFDYTGVLISEKKYHETNSIPVNIENLSKGIYFITIKNKNHYETQKIIIQ